MLYCLVWNKERKRQWQYYAVIAQENLYSIRLRRSWSVLTAARVTDLKMSVISIRMFTPSITTPEYTHAVTAGLRSLRATRSLRRFAFIAAIRRSFSAESRKNTGRMASYRLRSQSRKLLQRSVKGSRKIRLSPRRSQLISSRRTCAAFMFRTGC